MNEPEGDRPTWAVDLYWLPLGAGGHFVRLNGRLYEAIRSRLEHRAARALYHCGLEVHVPEGRYVIEMTPAQRDGNDRGVVGTGPVGAAWAGRLPMFRYELRRWLGGSIPDIDEAVDSPRRLTESADVTSRVLELVPQVPMLVWGRDELHAGDMWNSNSQIAWILDRAGLDAEAITPPGGGRAPGWKAGVSAARSGVRSAARRDQLPIANN